MFKRLTAVAVLGAALITPGTVTADGCSAPFAASARIAANGDGTASGTAVVRYSGGVDRIAFDSQFGPAGTIVQQWMFDEGTVEIIETPNGTLIGDLEFIDSDVAVTAPDSGSWEYSGVFNRTRLAGTFRVSGTLCFGS